MLRTVGLVMTVVFGVLAAPLASTAQPPAKVPNVGVLFPGSTSPPSPRIEAFRQGLRELGYVEGQNIGLEYRYAEGRDDRFPDLAAELVRQNVNLIVAVSTPAAQAAMNATETIPIVFVGVADPVATGLTVSLARPGQNITGLTSLAPELIGKLLQLLQEAVPNLSRVAVLWNSTNLGMTMRVREAHVAAEGLGLKLQLVGVRGAEDFERAFATIARERPEALLTTVGPIPLSHRRRIVEFAAKSRLPTMYEVREFVDEGGLMSYGPSLRESFRRAAAFVDKILKGAKPAELPVEQPTRFELVINLKTAKALGLTIPQSVLVRADQVIE